MELLPFCASCFNGSSFTSNTTTFISQYALNYFAIKTAAIFCRRVSCKCLASNCSLPYFIYRTTLLLCTRSILQYIKFSVVNFPMLCLQSVFATNVFCLTRDRQHATSSCSSRVLKLSFIFFHGLLNSDDTLKPFPAFYHLESTFNQHLSLIYLNLGYPRTLQTRLSLGFQLHVKELQNPENMHLHRNKELHLNNLLSNKIMHKMSELRAF